MRKAVQYLLFSFFLAVISIPLLAKKWRLIEEAPLKGAWLNTTDSKFEISRWFSGDFQTEKEKFLNDNFYYRSWAVRLRNQIDFSLFKKLHADEVIMGKNNYLYEENYIKAYNGLDFVGHDSIAHVANRLENIQKQLHKLNKDLLLVFAPGKGTFYPEFIPDGYEKKDHTNLEVYNEECKRHQINLIDFNTYFQSNKHKFPYPLYPQFGIHWSTYGTFLALDSMLKRMEVMRNIDLPDLITEKVDLTTDYQGTDYDIADGLNLITKFKSFPLAYPHYKTVEQGKQKPKVLFIADSFYWTIFNQGTEHFFHEGKFWYYNQEIYRTDQPGVGHVSDIDLKKEILENDIIVILSTDANLPKLGWGFIEKAEKLLGNGV